MAAYDFDEILDRNGSDCEKWDGCRKYWGRDDLLPMWVADMDFRTPPFVFDSIREKMRSGVLGYTLTPPSWREAVCSWQKRRHLWDVEPSQVAFIPGIVRGFAYLYQALSQKGDKVLVMPPVYHPFFLIAKGNEREVVYSPLYLEKGETHPGIEPFGEQYHIDFDRLEKDVKGCRILMLCNPHNPGGRCWRRDELQKVAHIAAEAGAIVVSDEIHADLTLPPYEHIPFATVSQEAEMNSVTFGAPTKAFNMPGLVSSYAIVPNPDIRKKFFSYLEDSEYDNGCMFSYDACTACYTKGEEWLSQMLSYVKGNIDFLEDYLAKNIPSIGMVRPQASYLVWLDCRSLGLSQERLVSLFEDGAHLALNNGEMFGKGGTGFMRMNVGCPRSVLETALGRLKAAVEAL